MATHLAHPGRAGAVVFDILTQNHQMRTNNVHFEIRAVDADANQLRDVVAPLRELEQTTAREAKRRCTPFDK